MIASAQPTFVSSLRASVVRHPGGAFLAFFYITSWILFLPSLLGSSGFGVFGFDLPPQPSILLLSLIALAGGAFVVTRIVDGPAGIRELRHRVFSWRAGPQWYILALFGAPTLLLLAGVFVRGPSALADFSANLPQFVPTYLLQVVLIAVLVSLWEETGWTAFLTARWQKRIGPALASIAIAPLFGLGHLPLLFISGGITDSGKLTGSQFPEYLFYLLVLFSIPVRLMLTWAFNSTGGVLPVVALLHASLDTTGSTAVLTGFYPAVDGRLLYVGLMVVVTAILVITRGRLGYRDAPVAVRLDVASAPAALPLR
jgi:CAAX protease family protein